MVIEVVNLAKCVEKFKAIANIDYTQPIVNGSTRVAGKIKRHAPNDRAKTGGLTPSGKISKSKGDLARSVHRTTKNKGKSNVTAVISVQKEYAVFQEFGTTKMKAQPFVLPAVREEQPKIQKDMIEHAQKEMKQIANS